MTEIVADGPAVDQFVRRRTRGLVATALFTIVPAIGILVLDYRLMLFAIVLLALPLVVGADLIRLRSTVGAGRMITLRWGPGGGVELQSMQERVVYMPQEVAARVTPDMIVIAAKRRMWVVPASRDAANAAGIALQRLGAGVAFERRGIVMLAAFFGAVILDKLLRVVASALVLGAIANIGLAATHHGGSYVLGAELLGGALAALTTLALLQITLGIKEGSAS